MPVGVPVVTFKPGDRSLLVAGANVLVTAQLRNGKPTALRALAGRGGFVPPMWLGRRDSQPFPAARMRSAPA